jgi:hypothetical protein
MSVVALVIAPLLVQPSPEQKQAPAEIILNESPSTNAPAATDSTAVMK